MAELFQVKAIKPKKLKVESYVREIEKALRAEGKETKAEFEKTVATWKKKPKFEVVTDVGPGDAFVFVGTDDEVYGYVDEGTRPHIIRPKRARRLRFRSGFRPKTTPGKIGSGPGGKFGSVVYARAVMHPGTKARNFTAIIAKRRRKKFTRRMVKAMQAGARKSF